VNRQHRRIATRLHKFALGMPGAWEDHPWGETVVRVNKKVFVFFGMDDQLGLSAKLPDSREAALTMPFAKPTGYGLGRGGWVTSVFEDGDEPPTDILCDWIEESYRAIAPKKLVAELDERAGPADQHESRRSGHEI
jgi:predicted DNA-binding protein (MmcQ/YjbR family)